MANSKLTARASWQALTAHYQQIKDLTLRQLFADKASDATFNFRKDLKRRYRDYRNFVITHII